MLDLIGNLNFAPLVVNSVTLKEPFNNVSSQVRRNITYNLIKLFGVIHTNMGYALWLLQAHRDGYLGGTL